MSLTPKASVIRLVIGGTVLSTFPELGFNLRNLLPETGMGPRTAWVCFPAAPYTHASALKAANKVLGEAGWQVRTPEPPVNEIHDSSVPIGADLYLADYDLLPFEQIHKEYASTSDEAGRFPQISSYMIRKSLIRKNHLAHSIHLAKVKADRHADSVRRVRWGGAEEENVDIAPRTTSIELTCADELDELLADDLYDVRQVLEANEARDPADRQWFILKPAMADQGMGIRLFDTVDSLNAVFEEFEDLSDDEDDEAEEGAEEEHVRSQSSTAVITSQVRQFVVQEYLSNPLLIQAPTLRQPHKFHIRAYVLAQGSLRVFLYDHMLALFAAEPYARPVQTGEAIDLSCHLTNTSRQDDDQSQNTVHLLSDLVDCPFSTAASDRRSLKLTSAHLDSIRTRAAAVIARAFLAAVQAGRIHFQPWPNAWEIFGIDLMITLDDLDQSDQLRVWLLEVNAQPDFAKSGARLQEKIDILFERSLQICTVGHDDPDQPLPVWQPGESRDDMTLCLEAPMSAQGW